MNKGLMLLIVFSQCLMWTTAWSGEHGHEHGTEAAHAAHGGEHGHEGGDITLTPEQLLQAGLKVITLKPEHQAKILSAPGVVRYDDYKIADVTSMVDAIVDARHVRLGEQVKRGDALITLKSTALAQAEANWLRAQAEYRKSEQEYRRLRPLAADGIVSQARLQTSRSAYETARAQQLAARATLASYGLSESKIRRLDDGKGFGLVTLRAAIDGTVIADQVVLGQHIAAGSRLMRIVDESTVWVEANIPPSRLMDVQAGAAASVVAKGTTQYLQAKVAAIHHELDATTRTAIVRLEVDNAKHALHAGMFVDVEIRLGDGEEGLLLPASAVQRQGSEHIVFVEEKTGHFERREVEVEAVGMGKVRIRSGLKAGEKVVFEGSFALLSELLKSGFEAHNH